MIELVPTSVKDGVQIVTMNRPDKKRVPDFSKYA